MQAPPELTPLYHPPPLPPNPTPLSTAEASSCAELDAKIQVAADYMKTQVKGKFAFTIQLSCAAGAKYDDCPAASLMPKWFVTQPGPVLTLTIQGAPGCASSRPVLSGASATYEPLIMSLEKNLFINLQDIVLDGGCAACFVRLVLNFPCWAAFALSRSSAAPQPT